MDDKRYIAHRKKTLKVLHALIYERDKINSEIRRTRMELAAWDRYLLQEE